ncbi:hypothetical protein O206_11125 [Ochrobactrum sp. EGD-AQ16]|nr:hypothetical protein O206_11125 [Ochrobactrum sp. EGD-AQ16]
MNNISYIESIDRFQSEGSLVVWLNKAGREALNCENAYEINSRCGCANIEWTDVNFGEQHIEISPGGSEDARILDYMLSNPESAIEDILSRLEKLKDKAAQEVSDIRREFLDGTAALVFKLGGSETCEWLEADDHNALTNSDSHLSCNHGSLNLEVINEELNDWLEENPVKIEWVKGNDNMDGGSYDTLAEAEAALEGVKAEFFAQCGTDENRVMLEAGEFRILW